ncbi:MAG: hypothetical protein ACOC3G_07870 [Phycisphaeraceae bacterium]
MPKPNPRKSSFADLRSRVDPRCPDRHIRAAVDAGEGFVEVHQRWTRELIAKIAERDATLAELERAAAAAAKAKPQAKRGVRNTVKLAGGGIDATPRRK